MANKASKKQIEFMDTVIQQIEFWKSSNDIKSSTLDGDIEEHFNKYITFEEWDIDDYAEAVTAMDNLLKVMRNIK